MYHLRLQKPLELNQLGFFFVAKNEIQLIDRYCTCSSPPPGCSFEHLMRASKVYTYKQTLHRKYAERKNLPIHRNTIYQLYLNLVH